MANKTISILIIILLILGCKKDPCESVICVNGGDCLHGSCYCPTGYYGSDCSQQFTPSKIIIDSLIITNFPLYDSSGITWDTSSYPDIFPEIDLSIGSETAYWSWWIEPNRVPNYNHLFIPYGPYNDSSFFLSNDSIFLTYPSDTVFDFTQPTSQYTFKLWDYDYVSDSNGDLMGQIDFTPYKSNNKFPSVISLDSAGLSTDIYISYIW